MPGQAGIAQSPVGSIQRVDQITGELVTIDVYLADGEAARHATSGWGPWIGNAAGCLFNWHAVAAHWPQRNVLCAFWNGRALALVQMDDDYVALRGRRPEMRAVYVSFLEVNPLFRTGGRQRRFVGVGAAMLSFAVVRSKQLGYGGRVGLHAIEGAIKFYEKLGFCRTGEPGSNEYWEAYLELEPAAAESFLLGKG